MGNGTFPKADPLLQIPSDRGSYSSRAFRSTAIHDRGVPEDVVRPWQRAVTELEAVADHSEASDKTTSIDSSSYEPSSCRTKHLRPSLP